MCDTDTGFTHMGWHPFAAVSNHASRSDLLSCMYRPSSVGPEHIKAPCTWKSPRLKGALHATHIQAIEQGDVSLPRAARRRHQPGDRQFRFARSAVESTL